MGKLSLTPGTQGLAVGRLAIGLVQGLVLYLLYRAAADKLWPATEAVLFIPLVMVALFAPLIPLQGFGVIRSRALAIWTILAVVLLAYLGYHDANRAAPPLFPTPVAHPSFHLFAAAAAILFIAQALIAAAQAEGRLVARYPVYYDAAWKQAVQLALAGAFVAAFWGVLELGAALFRLITLKGFGEFIEHGWFAIPATALAAALAVHITDVRAGIVRGVRTLALTLLAWLLPLAALIVLGFLASMLFISLEPLWRTHFAARLLLVAAAALILLVNAAYQDGGAERAAPRAMRYAGTVAALLLVPLVAIAGYALALRVGQYGWTGERVIAAALLVIAACYGAGYAAAALWRGPWLRRLEACNIAASFLIIAVLLALATPIADPVRIAVASQVARLASGKVAPEKFDFTALRFDGTRYGREALEKLKATASGPEADFIRAQVDKVLAMKYPTPFPGGTPPSLEELAANIAVHPEGKALPRNFLPQAMQIPPNARWLTPACFRDRTQRCDAVLVDLDGSGEEQIVLISPRTVAAVFKTDGKGAWTLVGSLQGRFDCEADREALRTGRFQLVAHLWKDVEVNGYRMRVQPLIDPSACPSP